MAQRFRLTTRRYPELKIWVPAIKGYRQFAGGILDISDDDPAFESVKAIAIRRPDVEIRKQSGETAEGRPTTTTVKSAADFVCDVCNPPTFFVDEADLAAHTAELHTAAPTLGEDGSDTAATDRQPRPRPTAVRRGTVKTK